MSEKFHELKVGNRMQQQEGEMKIIVQKSRYRYMKVKWGYREEIKRIVETYYREEKFFRNRLEMLKRISFLVRSENTKYTSHRSPILWRPFLYRLFFSYDHHHFIIIVVEWKYWKFRWEIVHFVACRSFNWHFGAVTWMSFLSPHRAIASSQQYKVKLEFFHHRKQST